ncbi:MAG: hypothetical protein A2821_04155 [Candidatus Magasanikbacteria bacterium RIFCSPHIGHO2_01_FULL_41_23]|nr:MAG: hypothetical protein A2821_04155 [Candidatus Magasanikbacteria bacterium RIFCSPHIGHO2_01_FULL_41_23]OGH67231.1 MAG: hypothetical protein A3C66_00615 [Candidatus Magasanikbacteria bacterium RIFCSPHIGHO2_02_FULL_41_35]
MGEASEYELVLVHLNKVLSTEQVLVELDRCGLEAGNIGQLLAFGEKFPDIQREFPIIALGSVCVSSNGSRCSPYLGRDDRERGLDLSWVDRDWYEDCRFVAFRKVAK